MNALPGKLTDHALLSHLAYADAGHTGFQAALVSGTNIKTINSNSLLGAGDLAVTTSPAGSDTQIQFNNSGAFGASSNLIWDGTNQIFKVRTGTLGGNPQTVELKGRGGVNGNPSLYFTNGTDTAFFDMSGGGVEFVNEGSGLIALGTDNALYLYIVSGGNVGVGTGTPAFDLDVSGNINASTSFYCGSTAGVSSGGAIAVYNDGSTAGQLTSITIVGGIITAYTTL